MDIVLRARHDELVQEFRCTATDLRLMRTPRGSEWTRTIDAYCTDNRAERFGTQLTTFVACCADCSFLSFRGAEDGDETSGAEIPEVRESA